MRHEYYGWLIVAFPLRDDTWDWRAYAPGNLRDILINNCRIWKRHYDLSSASEAIADAVWHIERYLALDAINKVLGALCLEGKLTPQEMENGFLTTYTNLENMQPLPKL